MSDERGPKPLKVFTCYDPTGKTAYCYALVEDTGDTRREHRAWHAHEEATKQGFRNTITKMTGDHLKAIKARDDEIASLRQEIADLNRDVDGIEIPQPVLGIEIDRDGYTDDELDEYIDVPQTGEVTTETGQDDEEASTATPPISTAGLYPHADDDYESPLVFRPAP